MNKLGSSSLPEYYAAVKKDEDDLCMPGWQDSHTLLNAGSQLQKHIFKVYPFRRKQSKATLTPLEKSMYQQSIHTQNKMASCTRYSGGQV